MYITHCDEGEQSAKARLAACQSLVVAGRGVSQRLDRIANFVFKSRCLNIRVIVCQAIASDFCVSMQTQTFSLPPGVRGDVLGEIALTIDRVQWAVKGSSKVGLPAGPVFVRAKWWGDEGVNGASIFLPATYPLRPSQQDTLKNTIVYGVRGDISRYLSGSSLFFLLLHVMTTSTLTNEHI